MREQKFYDGDPDKGYWENLFGLIGEYAEASDTQKVLGIIELNKGLNRNQLLDELPSDNIPDSALAGMNFMVGIAYWKSESLDEALQYLERAWSIVNAPDYSHSNNLRQKLLILDYLYQVAHIRRSPRASEFARTRAEITGALGRDAKEAWATWFTVDIADENDRMKRDVNWEIRPDELHDLTPEILTRLVDFIESSDQRVEGMYGAQLVHIDLPNGRLTLGVLVEPHHHIKSIAVAWNAHLGASEFWTIPQLPEGSGAEKLGWDKRVDLNTVLNIIQLN